MYTNELLEEKYKAQKELQQQAELKGIDYHKFIVEDVLRIYKENGWELNYSKRKGGPT